MKQFSTVDKPFKLNEGESLQRKDSHLRKN